MALKERETRRAQIAREIARLDDRRAVSRIDPRQIERDLRKRAAKMRRFLGQHTPITRQIVVKLSDGRIIWTRKPHEKCYEFEGKTCSIESSRA